MDREAEQMTVDLNMSVTCSFIFNEVFLRGWPSEREPLVEERHCLQRHAPGGRRQQRLTAAKLARVLHPWQGRLGMEPSTCKTCAGSGQVTKVEL